MTKEIKINNLSELKQYASKISQCLLPGDCICLEGQMGAGKTTLVSALAAALNAKQTVTSPTFTLIQHYDADIPLIHMDLYRIDTQDQIIELDLARYMQDPEKVCLIEWSEKLEDSAPDEYIKIELKYIENKPDARMMYIKSQPERKWISAL